MAMYLSLLAAQLTVWDSNSSLDAPHAYEIPTVGGDSVFSGHLMYLSVSSRETEQTEYAGYACICLCVYGFICNY